MGSILSLELGNVGENSHPVHPATVHLPIAFILTGSVLDMVSAVGLRAPGVLYPLMKLTTSSGYPNGLDEVALLRYLSLFSYVSTVAAIFTSVPALTSGVAELYAMVQAKGLDMKNTVVRTTVIHAALNDIAIFGAVYNWWSRRGRTGFELHNGNIATSALMLGGVMYSAYLGGSLVYEHGVGVQRMGHAKKIKEHEIQKTKEQGKKEL